MFKGRHSRGAAIESAQSFDTFFVCIRLHRCRSTSAAMEIKQKSHVECNMKHTHSTLQLLSPILPSPNEDAKNEDALSVFLKQLSYLLPHSIRNSA